MCKWIEKGRSLCRRKCLVFWEKERLCSLLSCALSTRHRLRPDYKVIKRSGEIPVMQCRSAFAAALAGIPHNLYNYAVSPLTKGWNRGLFLFVRVRLQECVEVTHRQIVTPNNTHVRNVLTILVQSLNSCDYIVQMLLGQTAAVDCEANYVTYFSLLLRGLQVILHGVVAQLGYTDAVAADQLKAEALTSEGVVAALAVEELIHVDVYSVAACRQYNALNASVVEAFCQVVTLSNTLVHVVEVAGLVQANCQSHDVTAGHAAVGIVAVAGDLLNLQQNANIGLNGAVFVEVGEVLPEQALIAECQHAAHVSVAVLLRDRKSVV